jgi:hypothetical protein
VCQTERGLVIKVNKYKRAVTPGQYAVLAKDGECLGSAPIANTGVSRFSLFYLNNTNANVSSVLKKYVSKTNEDESELTDGEDLQVGAVNR